MGDQPSLVVLPYLQGWDGSKLSIRVLMIPRGSPFASLDPTSPTAPNFTKANFKFDVHLLRGSGVLPALSSGSVVDTLTFDALPSSLAIFNGLLAQLASSGLGIDPSPPGAGRVEGSSLGVHKYLPLSYREAVGTVSQSSLFPSGKTYSCSLKERKVPSKYVPLPPTNKKIAWGRLITALLRNPKLAEAAGLIRSASISLSHGLLEDGAFIFLTVGSSSTLSNLPLKTFAARISALRVPRSLFSPIFFPVKDPTSSSTSSPLSDYNNIFGEAEDYDDGWAKAVHCVQPQQLDPMKDEPDGTRPVTELGIRIGWDDEQVTIWCDRQMDPSNIKLDSPVGVQGYRIDAQMNDTATWHSLVRAKGPCLVNGVSYGEFDGQTDELGIEVHPSQQLDTDDRNVYWLPIYFTTWSGPSLVTLDNDRIRLAGGADRSQEVKVKGVTPGIFLTYGNTYKFRVRLMDHTGGGPTVNGIPSNPGLNPICTFPFRRWIRPLAPVFVSDIPVLSDDHGAESAPSSMEVKRPNLRYPAVVCTGNYSNPIDLLLQDLQAMKLKPVEDRREPSLPDPDVDRIEITVLISTLTQDPLAIDGTYMKLYTTTRKMPTSIYQSLTVSFSFRDVNVVFNSGELQGGWNVDATTGPLLFPTARTIRLRVGALCREDPTFQYFGADDVRRSPTVMLSLRKKASTESNLLIEEATSKTFNAYFLQPDPLATLPFLAAQKATGNKNERLPNISSRLAAVVGLRNEGMTMRSLPGERIVFACSGALRHTLGPDGATLSFTSQADIALRWVIVIRLVLNRDWSWDDFELEGIRIQRDGKYVTSFAPSHNVNHDAFTAPGPDRSKTNLVIFDAIDPDLGISTPPQELRPKYTVSYSLVGRPSTELNTREFTIGLPVTAVPRQIPQIVSSGIAMSPYVPSGDYSTTNVRHKVLWIEFAEPILDPRDNYFCRVLRNAPDPLLLGDIGTFNEETPEPALPIPSEATLRIIPNQANDHAALDLMQPLAQSTSSPRHFSVPLPAGLSPSSPELFGFFTYEFRVGHADLSMWTTAQGRFGAPLRCTGIQHPAPQLTCSISRSDHAINVSASCAVPIRDGINVLPTFDRPTRIIILLYAQAFQISPTTSTATNSAPQRRNILLFTREGSFGSWSFAWAPGVVSDPWGPPDQNIHPIVQDFNTDPENRPKTFATATFLTAEVNQALERLGLWRTTPLSVLAVEMLPQGQDHVTAPLGADIGRQRILRTGTLCAVPAHC